MVEIIGQDYAFDAPDEILSGWTTFRFTNEGSETHFFYIMRLPDDKTIDNYAVDLYGPLNELWYGLRDKGIDRSEALQQMNLPEWYKPSEFDRGGAGFIAPGRSTQITIYLDPGTYILDCFMKTKNGEIHGMEGMMREIVVTDKPSELEPPVADFEITLSNFDLMVEGNLTPGRHTVAVHAQDFGHTVHVARLEPDADVDTVVKWMDWFTADGMVNSAPATFMGGMYRLTQGSTGYFTLDLEPGRYLFASNYTAHRGVLKEVTVEP